MTPEKIFEWWDRKDDKGKVGCLAILFLSIGVLFWIPFTRAVIILILPLGSGVDDIIFLGGLVVGIILLVMRFMMAKNA